MFRAKAKNLHLVSFTFTKIFSKIEVEERKNKAEKKKAKIYCGWKSEVRFIYIQFRGLFK